MLKLITIILLLFLFFLGVGTDKHLGERNAAVHSVR